MIDKPNKPLPAWLPFVIGTLLVIQFAGLGGWQVSRGLEKRAQQDLFADESAHSRWRPGNSVRPYQPLQLEGRYDNDHHILLDNIIMESRYGYYVLTPFRLADSAATVLVNRGWLEKPARGGALPELTAPEQAVRVRGRAGSLPRAGYRMGESIEDSNAWPLYAVYPTREELSAALGYSLEEWVVLLDPEAGGGFFRHWVPEEMGPGRHFGYALQWFAMGAVLAALLIWHYRRRKARRG